jgi:hypothetical protein
LGQPTNGALVTIPEPQNVGPAAPWSQFQSHKSLGKAGPSRNNVATIWLRLATVGHVPTSLTVANRSKRVAAQRVVALGLWL